MVSISLAAMLFPLSPAWRSQEKRALGDPALLSNWARRAPAWPVHRRPGATHAFPALPLPVNGFASKGTVTMALHALQSIIFIVVCRMLPGS